MSPTVDRERLAQLLEREREHFATTHPRSRELHDQAAGALMGGVPMNWMSRWPGPWPVFVTEAQGAEVVDVDGNRYADFCLGDTGAMCGHAPPATVEAISQQAARGLTTMLPTEDAVWVGEELARRFGLPLWQLALSATDANRFALRIARAATGRPTVIVFNWCYHGSVDETLGILAEDGSGRTVERPGSVGPQVDPALTTRVVEFNDVAALEAALAPGDVAAVLAEPALTNIGIVLPDPGFHDALRALTREAGTLLVIDETHTLCAGPGGMTARDGLTPDMLTVGKPIAGGVPAGAYGMTAEVAAAVRGPLVDAAEADASGIGGTLSGNALTLAAVRATLGRVLVEDAYEHMIALGERWAAGVDAVIDEVGVPWHVQRLGCRAEYWFCPPPRNGGEAAAAIDHELDAYLHLHALNRGILLTPFHNMALMSPATTATAVDHHTDVFREAVAELVGVGQYDSAAMTTDPYRLPRTVIPARYELTLEPDLENATFSGECSAEVEVIERIDEVVLNANDLEIHEAWIEQQGADGQRVAAEVRLDPDTERAHLLLAHPVDPGGWFVVTRFRGGLNDQLTGFYRSSFTDDAGATHHLATSQMEATHARQAFPCWDEPELKAVFAITLVVPDGTLALSNARELHRRTLDDGRIAVQFADTMVMSTYLVACVVGPLEVTPPVDVENVPLRIAHRPGQGHLTASALDIAAFALRYFEDYYGIVYPGGKLDLVAIPDFAFGAMENTGCVTFREILLLVDPEGVTQPELQNVVDVISHEIAHMWFGNLVTMRWWNGIWLNEAFATFMEVKATDAYRPDWERWTTFGNERTAAFDVDSLTTTRPIEYEVVSPEDAEGMFDVLTYEKGGAVLRMLEQYLGEDQFRDGIRAYLQKHQFANTETTDLWDAIEQATGEPVRRLMDTWIFQGGYPVVNVEPTDSGIRLRQERFLYLDDGSDHSRWIVPVILRHGGAGAQQLHKVLLEDETVELELPGAEWVHVNWGASGFYRVRYTPELLDRLLEHVDLLSASERYALVDDTWASVLAGDTSAIEFLEFAERFTPETDLAVWQRLLGGLAALDRIVDGDARAALQARVRDLLAPARGRLADEPPADDRGRQLRATLFEHAAELGMDPEAAADARLLWDDHLDQPGSIDPALLVAAINVIASRGDEADFDAFWGRYQSAPNPQEELRFLGALADFDEPRLFDRLLAVTLTDDVRTQNAPYTLRRALHNRTNGPRAWEFVRDQWDALNDRFPSNSIVRMVEGVRSLSQPGVADDVLAFFEDHQVPQGARTLAQHLERLRVNMALRERETDRFREALLPR